MIINRIYEHKNLLPLVSFLVGIRTYQNPCRFAATDKVLKPKITVIYKKE